jgi:hypothetical protein
MPKSKPPKLDRTSSNPPTPPLVEGVDYYIEKDARWVFTENYHRRRGYCCESGCRHCPYGYAGQPSSTPPSAR